MKIHALFILLLFSCSSKNKQATINENKKFKEPIEIESKNNIRENNDQAISVLSDSKDVEIKPLGGILEKTVKDDTLTIVSTDDLLFYPFGLHYTTEDFIGSNKAFTQKQVLKTNNSETLQKLIHEASYLLLIPDKRVGGQKDIMEIVSGRIADSKVELLNGIKIGCSKNKFENILFDNKEEDYSSVNVFKLQSGLDGIHHLYRFNDNKLVSIEFVSNYQFP